MNRLVSRNILVILQLIVSAGSFYNSLYWILFLVGFTVTKDGIATLSGAAFFLPLFLVFGIIMLIGPLFAVLFAFIEVWLGYVGMRLSYNFWKLKAGNGKYILFQSIIIFLSCFYLFTFSLFMHKPTPIDPIFFTEKYSPSLYMKIANVLRITISSILLIVNHFKR